jgi:hypothetical protein
VKVLSSQPTDPATHQAAIAIASRCVWIIRCCLREEEWRDAQVEFYNVAREQLEKFNETRKA